MPHIILKERIAHLGSYTFLQEMLININTSHFHSSINHQEQLFHRTLITGYFRPVNIAKFLRTVFFIYGTLPEAAVCRYSSKQVFLRVLQTSQESTCVGVCFLKTCRLKVCIFIKKTPTQAFSCKVCKIFKNIFSYRITSVTASAPPVAASVFFKKILFNSYFATFYDVLIIFPSRHIV